MKKVLSLFLGLALVTACSDDDNTDPIPVDPTSYTGDLSIRSVDQLANAVELGERLTTFNGDLYIETGSNTGITAADVSAVTAVIQSVSGNLTVVNPDGGINLSALTTVGGDYRIIGNDVQDNAWSLSPIGKH